MVLVFAAIKIFLLSLVILPMALLVRVVPFLRGFMIRKAKSVITDKFGVMSYKGEAEGVIISVFDHPFSYLKGLYLVQRYNGTGSVKVGDTVSVDVLTQDGEQISLDTSERPLLLLLGSFTCPAYRYGVKVLEEAQKHTEGKIDYATVYGGEAHAKDGWVIPNNPPLNQHVTFDERVKASKHLNIHIPVYIDSMDDKLTKTLDGHPTRLLIIENGRISWFTQKVPEFFPHEVMPLITKKLGLPEGTLVPPVNGNNWLDYCSCKETKNKAEEKQL